MDRETPQPPAHAYRVMVDVLGDRYFKSQPPKVGTRLTVVGNDRIETKWDVASYTAPAAAARAAIRGCHVVGTPYQDRPNQ